MKFSITREALMKPLNLVAGIVERRQTLPVLSNVLLVTEGSALTLTATDSEVEMRGQAKLAVDGVDGRITVPARKFLDICKSLPDESLVELTLEGEKVRIKAGRSRFTLSTLPASDFPSNDEGSEAYHFKVGQAQVRRLIERTSFAMAQQDVRYYLNGMLWELAPQHLRMVATDGHRLAMCTLAKEITGVESNVQIILPRKGVLELSKLLSDDQADVELIITSSHIRASTEHFSFSSKLVDGRFPDYSAVLPKAATKSFTADRSELRQALARTSILSNEKYRGVRLQLQEGELEIVANNPEEEQADERMAIQFDGEEVIMGFNVSYLLDVLAVLDEGSIKMSFSDPNSSALLEEAGEGDSAYVVMPMRL